MIKVDCDRCQEELDEPGAVVLSPPFSGEWFVRKLHLCVDCYTELFKDIA